VAILPFYVGLAMGESSGADLAIVRVLRMVRIFRVMKVGKYNDGMQLFSRVLGNSLSALYLLGFFLTLAVVFFGSVIFLFEQGEWHPPSSTACSDGATCGVNHPKGVWLRWDMNGFSKEPSPFLSIPHAFWWVIVTVTTIGYGDYYPTSAAGKMIAVMTFMVGILVLALPITIIGANFTDEYALVKEKKLHKQQERLGVVKRRNSHETQRRNSLLKVPSQPPTPPIAANKVTPASAAKASASGAVAAPVSANQDDLLKAAVETFCICLKGAAFERQRDFVDAETRRVAAMALEGNLTARTLDTYAVATYSTIAPALAECALDAGKASRKSLLSIIDACSAMAMAVA
jgi:hypothetical protein